MSQIVEITEEHTPCLYDSATGAGLTAAKVVDITDDCPSGERTILLFTAAKRGRIVQIAHPYPGQVYMGSRIHFFVDELDREMNVRPGDDTFGREADRAGMGKMALRRLIETHAPDVRT